MCKWDKIIKGLLLLFLTAAAVHCPLVYVKAESASAVDFQMKGDTLVKYTGTASAVSIPVSVKHIGTEAFKDHTELKKVDIPGYVESIDYHAFAGCSSLEAVTIPDMTTEIGTGAFNGCGGLQSVTFGKRLKKLGTGVFTDCTGLKELKIHKDNPEFSYDSGVIYNKDKSVLYGMLPGFVQDTYKMPSSVKEIKSNAFWGCMNLRKAEIGSNVETIPDYAFANCGNLEKVLLSYSVQRIGLKAFADCINLGKTEIPVSVREIHTTAFDGCPKLQIIAQEGSKAAEYDARREKSNVAQNEYQDMQQSTEGTGESDGENGNAEDGAAIKGEESGAGGGALGQSAVVGGNAVIFIDNSRSKVLTGNVQPGLESGTALPEQMDSERNGGFPKYTIINRSGGDGVNIASQAYYGDKGLTEYKMPETVKEIGDFAFARSGLTSIALPEGAVSIGYGAFYHCDALSSITIPDTVTEIEPAAFDETKWMEERLADRKNPFTIVGDGILVAYAGTDSKVEIPEGVKQIGAEVFKDKEHITVVMLPSSLKIIGEDAFAGCSSLTGVSGGNGVEKIADRAFAGCPVGTVKIPETVKEIGLKAYDLSETDKADGTKAAVFLGKKLPGVSCEKTATRMMNEAYREAVLKDVRLAVVDDVITEADIKDTVLDYDKGGFRGFVCSVEQAAKGDVKGRLRVKFCVLHEEDVKEVTIPKEVTIYGMPYEIANPEDAVVYASDEKQENAEEGTVTVRIDSATMEAAPAEALLTGNQRDYVLEIRDNTADGSAMSTSYKRVAKGGRMTSLQVYDMVLYDAKTEIPISRLGSQRMTVTVPKPKGISEDGLQVVCLDEDGQLEKVEARLTMLNGQTCVQFTAEHFSAYGFYN